MEPVDWIGVAIAVIAGGGGVYYFVASDLGARDRHTRDDDGNDATGRRD